QMFGAVAEVELLESAETPREQSRAYEQYECERNLRRHEPIADASSPSRFRSRSRVGSQRRGEIHSRGGQRGQNAENENRRDGHAQCNGEQTAVESNAVETRDLRRRQPNQCSQQSLGAYDAQRSAGKREERALHEQLADKVTVTRAQRPANG